EKLNETTEEARRKMEGLKLKGQEYKDEATRNESDAEREVGTVEVDVEETRPGYVASKLKEADQISGQAFNDVRHLDDEGKVRIEAGSPR
ncbi:hypothetical protein CMV_030246, partial [Castanea mollissima]